MTTEIKRLIRVRTEKGAVFKRDGFGKKKQLSDSWRKPRGQHNKQREQKKAKGTSPSPASAARLRCAACTPAGSLKCWCSRKKISKIWTRRPRRSGYQPASVDASVKAFRKRQPRQDSRSLTPG